MSRREAGRGSPPDDEPPHLLLRGERSAGNLLARAGVTAATWCLLVVVVAVPLSVAGWWHPYVGLPLVVVAAVAAVRLTRGVTGRPAPPWAAVLTLLVALGAGVWAGATHAEHVVLRRDAGTYALSGQHLGAEHTLRVDVAVAALGGPAVVDDPQVTVGSPGFFAQGHGAGTHVVPQFLPGTPVWLSVGWWLGGWTGLLLVPAVAGALALLALGGLAARVVGPRWAPLATAATAVAAPVLHAARSTYSEPFALLVTAAALSLLADATERGGRGQWRRARRLGLAAGLLAGGAVLLRVDALREVVLLLPVAALLAVRRNGAGGPLALGAAVGSLVSAAAAVAVSRPYLGQIAGSLVPLLALLVLVAGGCAAWVLVAQRGRPVALVRGARQAVLRAPVVLSALVVLVGLVLASRPLWQTVRQDPQDPGSKVVAGLQLRQGLPVDGGRTYAEHAVQWVAWWVGVPALVMALVAAGWAAYRLGRVLAEDRDLPRWVGPWFVAFGSVALTLWRPGITPDHPWADRRLVPLVLPAVALLATSFVAGAVRVARRRAPTTVLAVAGVAGAVLLLVPPLLATRPFLDQRTERGELATLEPVCTSFAPGDVALLVDSRAANEWTQLLRAACHVPTLVVRVPRGADPGPVVARVAPRIRAAGGRPVAVAAESGDAVRRAGGAAPRHLVHLPTTEDQRFLERRPDGGAALDVDLWAGVVAG